MFITLEGTEGCGKSTQAALLCEYLKKSRRRFFKTVEPGGTELGQAIRKLLLEASYSISPEAETLLYMASRAHLVREVIQPKLKAGNIVVCDRWLDATVAYQGYGLGVDLKWIKAVAKEVTQGLEPDLTLFLDLPVRQGLERARKRGKPDRIENRNLNFHKKVRTSGSDCSY